MKNCALAIDIGASSGRHILSTIEDGRIRMEEIYRFPNGFTERGGHDCWDVPALFGHMLAGMKRCAELGKIPDTIGIDTWGVDYVLLDANDQLVGDTVAYRDARTQGMEEILNAALPENEQYALTGIAHQPYNTVYQLMAEFAAHPEYREQAHTLLFMPCYLGYLLTGKKQNEYTIASTSGLLNAKTRTWDAKTLRAAGIPAALLGDTPVPPGATLGRLSPDIAAQAGFDCDVVLTACHDTGSAFRAIPAADENAVYLSSGTWSLLGAVLPQPILTPAAYEAGFTNEGGVSGIRFLQNIMGMWILQCLRHEEGDRLSFAQMAELAATGAAYRPIFDAAHVRFLNPESMRAAIVEALREQGDPLPETDAQLLYCVNHSLAVCYAHAIADLQKLTGRTFTSVSIVGGGCQNALLNQLTADETGLTVIAGPAEGTALGNLLVQLSNRGLSDTELDALLRRTVDTVTFSPRRA